MAVGPGAAEESGPAVDNAVYVALSSQMALRRHLELVANNMANQSTPGFKAERMMFREYLQETGATGQDGKKEGISFVQDIASYRDLTEGAIIQTGSEFDVAIAGEGYMTVETPDGPRYTRGGSLSLDRERRLVTAQGYPVLSGGGAPITLPRDAVGFMIAEDGTVSVRRGGDTKINIRLDRLGVVSFEDPRKMRNTSDGMMTTDQTPNDAEKPRVIQGALEQSNVQGIREMTDMMEILRTYQSVQKAIDSESERRKTALAQLSKTTAI